MLCLLWLMCSDWLLLSPLAHVFFFCYLFLPWHILAPWLLLSPLAHAFSLATACSLLYLMFCLLWLMFSHCLLHSPLAHALSILAHVFLSLATALYSGSSILTGYCSFLWLMFSIAYCPHFYLMLSHWILLSPLVHDLSPLAHVFSLATALSFGSCIVIGYCSLI